MRLSVLEFACLFVNMLEVSSFDLLAAGAGAVPELLAEVALVLVVDAGDRVCTGLRLH